LANLLPGMNLLYATYGHNHLAAFLILILPSSWWLAIKMAKKGKSWWWIPPVIFTLSLITSFGRVAVIIGFMQFLWIWKILSKQHLIKKQLQQPFKLISLLFTTVLIVKIVFSVANLAYPEFVCPVPIIEKQLCKPISSDARPEYWRWAIEVTKESPWIGTGPGTFGAAAKKHYLSPYSPSSHAHNAFLQNFAEMGLLGGGIFVILIFSLWWQAKKNLDNSVWDWRQAIFLGMTAIYVDVLLDFDWDFVGLLGLTILFLALLIRENHSENKRLPNTSWLKKLGIGFYFSAIMFLMTLTGLYLYTDGLIRNNQAQTAFDFFPYFHWHLKVYEKDPSLNDIQHQKLFKIYQSYPNFYSEWITLQSDEGRQQELRERWFEIDPFAAADNGKLVEFYLNNQDWVQVDNWLSAEQELLVLATNSGRSLEYGRKLILNERELILAKNYLENGEPERALRWLEIVSSNDPDWNHKQQLGELLIETGNKLSVLDVQKTVNSYNLAKENVPWILSSSELWFEEQKLSEMDESKLVEYLLAVSYWEDENLGWKDNHQFQQIAAERFLVANDWPNLVQLLELVDWSWHDYQWRKELAYEVVLEIDELVEQRDYQQALILLQTIHNFLPDNYWFFIQPANLMLVGGDDDRAQEFFNQCLVEFEDKIGAVHGDCFYELQALEVGFPNRDRYFQVSKIIHGELRP